MPVISTSRSSYPCPPPVFALSTSQNNWVPRRGDQGPKTIDQIHKDAQLEEHREHMKVQQAIISKKDSGGGPGGRMGGGGPGGRGGSHTPGRGAPPQDEGWNTVPISKNRPIDTSRLSKITKVGERHRKRRRRAFIRTQDTINVLFLITVVACFCLLDSCSWLQQSVACPRR